MFFPPKPVNLCQSDLSQLQAELKTLCKEARGPLRVFETKEPGSDTVFYLRERNLFEAAHEEISELFGFDVKRLAVDATLHVLERRLSQRIAHIGAGDATGLAHIEQQQDSEAESEADPDGSIPIPENVRQLLFARVLGQERVEPAEGMPMEQVCESVLALRDDQRYMARVPHGLSLCNRPPYKVIADAVVEWETDDGYAALSTAWADESQSPDEAMAAAGNSKEAWAYGLQAKLRSLADGVRTIALALPSDMPKDHIAGLLGAVKEKIRSSGEAGKPVSIMLAVEDPKLYDRVAEQIYRDAGSTYLEPGRLGFNPSLAIQISNVDSSQYDELLTHLLKLDEEARGPLRLDFGYSGRKRFDAVRVRTPGQLVEELFLSKVEIAKREWRTCRALFHAFASMREDATARGRQASVTPKLHLVQQRLVSKIGDEWKDKASQGKGQPEVVFKPFRIAADGKSPFDYAADHCILSDATISLLPAAARKELDRSIAALETEPKKKHSAGKHADPLQGDAEHKPSEPRRVWEGPTDSIELAHIDTLHIFTQSLEQPPNLPADREGFHEFYLDLLSSAKGSVVMGPIPDGWTKVENGKEGEYRFSYSDANLGGMLDAIAERCGRQDAGGPQAQVPSLPRLSVVLAGLEEDVHLRLQAMAISKGMLA